MNVDATLTESRPKALWWALAAGAILAFYAVVGGVFVEPGSSSQSLIALTVFDFVFHAVLVLLVASVLSLAIAPFLHRSEPFRRRFARVLPKVIVAVSLVIAMAFLWVEPLGPVPVGP